MRRVLVSCLGVLALTVLVLATSAGAQQFEGTREFGISLWAPETAPKADT